MPRPTGVTAIACLFLLGGIYLLGFAILSRVKPEIVQTGNVVWLLNALRLALPFPFGIAAIIYLYLAWGLLHLGKWARAIAIATAGLGFIFLIPAVSAAAASARLDLLWSGLHMITRVIILWYLFQPPVREAFERDGTASDNLSLR